jgi:poly-beta-hydroxyalkanoate depolymerase
MPLVASKRKELMEFDTGHIGLTTSRRSFAELWPRIADWMEQQA